MKMKTVSDCLHSTNKKGVFMKHLIHLFIICTLIMTTGCEFSIFGPKDDDNEGDSRTSAHTWLIVTTSDFFENATVSQIDLSDFSAATDLLDIHSDNVAACHDGSIYILERQSADNIIRIDGSSISSDDVRYQEKLGTSVNIHNIAFVNDSKAYITQYASSDLVIVDPSDGSVTGRIDLGEAPYTNGDETIPYMDAVMIVGDYAYVVLQRLQTVQSEWGPYPDVADSTGMIVVIDCATDNVVKKITLKKSNPASLDTCDGHLYVSSTGSWNDQTDGGIEKIDCSDNSLKETVLSESAFGGDITTLEIINKNKAYVSVGRMDDDFNFSTVIVECDLAAENVGEEIDHVEDAFGGIAYDGSYLYIGDRSESDPGVVVIDPDDNSKVAGPIDCGSLPPSSLAILTTGK
jgi:hypothetical protein